MDFIERCERRDLSVLAAAGPCQSQLGVGYLVPALDIPRFHHEHWDGKGYPDGLRGESIPLAARIFAVVDSWDALRSDRPYRKAWARGEVIDYIRERSGTQFDPQVVDAFLGIADEFEGAG